MWELTWDSSCSSQLFVCSPALIAKGLGERLSWEPLVYRLGKVNRRLHYREEGATTLFRCRLSIFGVTHTTGSSSSLVFYKEAQ